MDQPDVTRRRVLYIPGYDPFPPRRYRELYRKEGAEQARISGYDLEIEAKKGDGPFGWYAHSTIHGRKVTAGVEVLVWSDIVRNSMAQTIPATYLQLVQTAWAYIGSGALFQLMKLRKGPVIAALYPIFFLIFQLLIAIFLGTAVGILAQLILPSPIDLFAATLLSVVTLIGVLQAFRKYDGKFFAYYLMHDFAFSARWNGANPPALEARMAEFANHIADALQEDVDEVLIVGHSSGAHLAISILADLIRADRVPDDGPRLSFLSLGHVVPMMSFLSDANRLRADLHFLCQQENLFWVDVTAPGDGCSFALCDPVAVSGVAPDNQKGPLIFSAAFTQSLTPKRWRALKRRYFRLHFQYLCAFDAPKDYDYFQITAGPLTLHQRYKDRPPSKSRIIKPVNRHTSYE